MLHIAADRHGGRDGLSRVDRRASEGVNDGVDKVVSGGSVTEAWG